MDVAKSHKKDKSPNQQILYHAQSNILLYPPDTYFSHSFQPTEYSIIMKYNLVLNMVKLPWRCSGISMKNPLHPLIHSFEPQKWFILLSKKYIILITAVNIFDRQARSHSEWYLIFPDKTKIFFTLHYFQLACTVSQIGHWLILTRR